MNQQLLSDMFYASPELWYTAGGAMALLLLWALYVTVSLLQLRRKNYFILRDKERYAETLYASKDGYFAFIYPDEHADDAGPEITEHCSRRLAVILNLPDGIRSSLEDILRSFYKDDAEKILKYIALLREDGVAFEDSFCLKNGRRLLLNGVRISGSDGSLYSDIIWFRDISRNAEYIDELIEERETARASIRNLEDMLDNLPYPVWMRSPALNIAAVNKKYLEYAGSSDKENVVINNTEIAGEEGRQIARHAQNSNKPKRHHLNLTLNGERFCYELVETPFHSEQSLDKIATVGTLIDISEQDKIKRNLKQHQNAHLEILGALGTAFAVFGSDCKLIFYNQAFQNLWGLDESWLDDHPAYGSFLDWLREKRLLPEVPDYLYYKNEEQKMFSSIIEPKEDLLHLPDGRSFRRIRAPHIRGGLIFAFEDISDRLAARREYNSLISVQQEILDNIEEAVLIFASNGRLKFYNQAYVNLWDADEVLLQKEPTFAELLDSQKGFFANVGDWEKLRKDIMAHLLSSSTKTFALNRSDKVMVECYSNMLSNDSIMVLMRKTAAPAA